MTSLDELLAGGVVSATVVSSEMLDSGFARASVEVEGKVFDGLSHFSPPEVGSLQRVHLDVIGKLQTIRFV